MVREGIVTALVAKRVLSPENKTSVLIVGRAVTVGALLELYVSLIPNNKQLVHDFLKKRTMHDIILSDDIQQLFW
jgi:hypothetical protein